ncbi:MAG: hypothetical protein JO327_11085 [Nitrososphaeraceae archaeon]|nr:hypothetical protein [Nitrososphaeraceae archaeon]MBV9668658.1 hypothetical protein [Nitrososphaeraceae archaeon]
MGFQIMLKKMYYANRIIGVYTVRGINVVDWHHKNGIDQITRNQIVKSCVLTVILA